MMGKTEYARFSQLQSRVEKALIIGRPYEEVVPVLEELAREAPDGSEFQLFAHRHLAELCLEHNPWQAALHLKRLIRLGINDDAVFALLGLCQTLLGNYNSAVSAYRRALEIAPDNPWYHHNLGHLLDVGMGNAEVGAKHLRIAYRIESKDAEIAASLAHCLARLGQLSEARSIAKRAVDDSPSNKDHRALLAWVEQGAPPDKSPIPVARPVSDKPDLCTNRANK
jgi:tetratricopeptide (TPR) repeat protein